MDPKIQQAWENFLNPDVLKPRLIAASVYIAGFELLKGAIIERPREFYWQGFNKNDDVLSPKYDSQVLARHKSPVSASLDWLREMQAIDESDIQAFDRAKDCRNRLAHELLSLLCSKGLPPDFEARFQEMVGLLRKIEVWWIVNVEIPINDEINAEDVDKNEILSGREINLKMLCDIALNPDGQDRHYFDEFKKQCQMDINSQWKKT